MERARVTLRFTTAYFAILLQVIFILDIPAGFRSATTIRATRNILFLPDKASGPPITFTDFAPPAKLEL